MKITVYVFASLGDSPRIETFINETDWENRMMQEMGDARRPSQSGPPSGVTDLFKDWTLSERCPCGRQYEWHSKEFEIPVRVLVGLEGGCFLGAEATHDSNPFRRSI